MSCHTKEQLEQMLYDVVDALDLSDVMLDEHGPNGTPPAELVKIVLRQKDLAISMLRNGFVEVGEKPLRAQLTETQRLLDEANGKIAEQTQTITDMEADHNHCHEVMEQQMESERGKVKRLVDGIRNLRDVKGRFHTEQAADKLFALLTELEVSNDKLGEG